MKAVVFHGVGDIRLDDVPEPKIQQPQDAIVRITTSAISGSDLHMVRGTVNGMMPGTILGHEGVGIIEEVGSQVTNLRPGDRVVIPSTVACGYCAYCRAGYFAQCDNANPNGPRAGTAYFGGPKESGPFNGLQAEFARIPFASVGPVRLPNEVTDEQAILLSDIFPTGYFGAKMAHIVAGRTVAVFGCGPVGQFAIISALILGAARVIAVDNIPSRLEMAQNQGAQVINFDQQDPVEAILNLTGGIGVDRAIDAVGVDATAPHQGPAVQKLQSLQQLFEMERQQVAPQTNPQDGNWHPGEAPSLALIWAADALAKAGTLSIIGAYPLSVQQFPIGLVMNRNLAVNAGYCHHRRYIPRLLELVRTGQVNPSAVLTEEVPIGNVIEAYKHFDKREPGWVKVVLKPVAVAARRVA